MPQAHKSLLKVKKPPKHVEEQLRDLAKCLGLTYRKVVKEYRLIFWDPFIQTDSQFKTEQDRQDQALTWVSIRLSAVSGN